MSDLKVVRDGPTLEIVFARPAKKNALTLAMYEAGAAALAEAEADDTVVSVLFHGEGGSFTAGNDLLDFLGAPPEGEEAPVFRFLYALARATRPVVCAVDGAAVGIGTTMLLHADLAFAATTSKFALPFVPLGLVPEAASSLLMPARLGMVRASELLLLGEPFGAERALELGLVNRVLEAPGHLDAAREACAKLAARPKQAVRETKRLLRTGVTEPVIARMRVEAEQFITRLASEEFRAAVAAKLPKRAP